MLYERFVQGFRRTKHKTYSPLDDHWVISTVVVEGVWLFSNPTKRNSVCLWPSLVCKLDHRRRLGERFLWQIFLERNITKFRQKFRVWSKELSKCFSKLVISTTLCQQFWSNFEIFRKEIQNASTTPSKSNQPQNTVRWESWNVTTQPREINDRKSEVIAFVVNAGMNVTTNNFYIQGTWSHRL